ncbi:UNVERIFIED_CONTAM: hypothetical protein FKN15_053005 [Acipenser sinensis]
MLYVFSMFAKRFTPPARDSEPSRGMGEKRRTPDSPPQGLNSELLRPQPKPASLRALFRLSRIISAGLLKLGEYPASSDILNSVHVNTEQRESSGIVFI